MSGSLKISKESPPPLDVEAPKSTSLLVVVCFLVLDGTGSSKSPMAGPLRPPEDPLGLRGTLPPNISSPKIEEDEEDEVEVDPNDGIVKSPPSSTEDLDERVDNRSSVLICCGLREFGAVLVVPLAVGAAGRSSVFADVTVVEEEVEADDEPLTSSASNIEPKESKVRE